MSSFAMDPDPSAVSLRPFGLSDADDFLSFAGDDQVTRFGRWETLTSIEEALAAIRDVCIPHPWRRAVCVGDRCVGFVSAWPGSGDDRCRADFGYGLARDWWGKGVATRAVRMALPQVFVDFPDVLRIQAFVGVDNKASQRVLEKAGFTRDGLLRNYAYLKGTLQDLYLYNFLSTDVVPAD
ncbi:uncharacterized N-acetyltransferase p20-like [Rhodamnia argentea]|uniref:Uncharacterized N-acetyltransferase p20-like n=1 Tax=Rhodamnia argentea TaxID=178133 RepID=A0A8B8PJC9_9MYRT|nr:uncharacterized N-acetyltransferase p20-like [Rhodamnia argentea]